jgi:protein-disulfide isomerase
MRARILDAALVTLTLCAVVVTGLVARREFFPPAGGMQPPAPVRVPDWRAYAREGHRMGPADAPVTIVVFSDFQCPYCGILTERLHTVMRAHPREVAVVYRHYPLAGHPYALGAARASECAAAQERFPAFHDALFAAQDSIGVAGWDRFASTAHVPDLARFRACAAQAGPIATVKRDTVAGMRLRVSGTPTLLINDTRLQGAVPADTLEAFVRRALAAPRGGA